jgi:hypothetical protein
LSGIDKGVLAQREEVVFDWRERRAIPIAFVLAGGYTGGTMTEGDVVELHRLTIERAASSRLACVH